MIKKFVRKNFYKETSNEEFEFSWVLNGRRTSLQIMCLFILPLMFIMTFVPVLILDACEPNEFSIFSQIVFCVFITLYGIAFLLFFIKCFDAVVIFSNTIARKLHFILNTVKGEALSKNDFATIKKEEKDLFIAISTGRCQGYCYWVCFNLLNILKKGQIEFWSVRCFGGEGNDNKPYTMHAIYVNGDWAFDTFSARQYKVDELAKIYQAIKYKTFTFQDIEDVSYDQFLEREKADLNEWCAKNDCHVLFGKDLEV